MSDDKKAYYDLKLKITNYFGPQCSACVIFQVHYVREKTQNYRLRDRLNNHVSKAFGKLKNTVHSKDLKGQKVVKPT